MSDLLDEVLKHQYIYLPNDPSTDTIELGIQLGLAVAQAHRAPLTVLAPTKSSATAHPALAKLQIVTERSGHLLDSGVVLAWCPTYKVMEKAQQPKRSVMVLVEWIPGEFDAWARLHGAYNVVADEVMNAGLSDEAIRALDSILREGHKGWHDDIAGQMTRSILDDLAKAGVYDRHLVLAHARQTKSERSISSLKKILEEFEGSGAAQAVTDTSRLRTSRDW
jgi:hypothetical protein